MSEGVGISFASGVVYSKYHSQCWFQRRIISLTETFQSGIKWIFQNLQVNGMFIQAHMLLCLVLWLLSLEMDMVTRVQNLNEAV